MVNQKLHKLKRKLILLCYLALVCIPALPVCAQTVVVPAKEKVSLQYTATNAALVLQSLQNQTGYTFTFDYNSLKAVAIKNISLQSVSLTDALDYLRNQYGLLFAMAGNNIAVQRGAVAKAEDGQIAGEVVDEKSSTPVTAATVTVNGKALSADLEGNFFISIKPGTYILEVSFVGYQTKRVTEVVVRSNAVTNVHVVLTPATGTMAGVVVTSSMRRETVAALYNRQKNNAAISDGISAEQISRTPDNNVAQVLKRVSGLTVQDNKFVVVRGMSERYNNVLLNGSILPSTEPNRRNFSFDMIPSSLIDNVVVNKTATPDLPGEFTGGLVQVNTIDIPRENFIQVTAGTGWNSNSTGKDFYSTRRFNSDYRGEAGNGRTWLNKGWNSAAYQQALTTRDYATMATLNAKIPNNYGLYRYTAQPVQNYQLNLGRKILLKNDQSLGVIIAGNYRHEETTESYDAWFRSGPAIIDTASEYTFITAVGAVGNVAYQNKKNKLVWRNLFNRRFTHDNLVQTVNDKGGSTLLQSEYISRVEAADLWQTRLEGEHSLTRYNIRVSWFADIAKVTKMEPDTRYSQAQISYALDGTPIYGYTSARPNASTIRDGGLFAYSLHEQRKNIGGDITVPFELFKQTQKIKTGYWGTFRDADYRQASLAPTYNEASNKADELNAISNGRADYMIFTPENFASQLMYYRPVTATGIEAGDYYDGKQQLHAAYIMGDVRLPGKIRVIGGVRLEDQTMDVHTIAFLSSTSTARRTDTTIRYNEKDWLPSVNVVYPLTPSMNLRAAWSKTLARPDFKERSTFTYYDFKYRQAVYGITGLQYSRTKNTDVRWEWYPGAGEVIAVSGFYKKYDKPVEVVSNRQPDGKYTMYYYNLIDAKNAGVEIDIRKSLGFISKGNKFLQRIFISANGSYMESNVRYDKINLRRAQAGLPPVAVNKDSIDIRKRSLQGLSPYIINAGLNYQGDIVGVNVTYNRFGRRILFAGVDDYDDTYENPRDQIDLQLSGRLLKQRLELRFNISDLLNQYYIEYFNKKPLNPAAGEYDQTDNTGDPKGFGYNAASDWKLKRTRKGTNFSFTASYRF